MFEETEVKVTKKNSPLLARTENKIIGSISQFGKFLPKSQVSVQCRSLPVTSRGMTSLNQEENDDRSQIDPHFDFNADRK